MHDGGLIEDGLGDARFARNEDEDGGGNGSGLDRGRVMEVAARSSEFALR